MKKLVVLFFTACFLLPLGAGATISSTPVNQAVATGAAGTTQFTVTVVAPTAGNVEILYFEEGDATTGITSITQTNVTWAAAAVVTNTSGRRAEIWRTTTVSASAGTVVTVNTASLGLTYGANVTEWSTTGGLTNDATSAATGAASPMDAGTITPTAGRNTLIISGGRMGGNYVSGPTNSFTRLTVTGSARGEGAYLVATPSSGSYSTSFAESGTWGAAIASFVEPASASAPRPRLMIKNGRLTLGSTKTTGSNLVPAYVQSATMTSIGVNKFAVAYGSNVTAGNTGVAFLTFAGTGGATTTSFVDSLGNTWTNVRSQTDVTNGEKISMYVSRFTIGGANTVTANFAATPGDGGMMIGEYSGADTTNPNEGTGQNLQATPGTGANGVTCAAITASTNAALVMWMADTGALRTGTFTAGTNYVERTEGGDTGLAILDNQIEDRVSAPAGSQTPTGTQANNETTASECISLKPASTASTLFGGGRLTLR